MGLKALKTKLDAAKAALAAKPDDEALKAAVTEAQSAYDAALAAAEEEDDDEEDGDDEGDADPASGKKGKKKPDGEEDEEDEAELDVSDAEKTKAYIKRLRKENAKYRTEGKTTKERLGKLEKGLKSALGQEEDEEADPEALSAGLQAQQFRNAILESALEHGIQKTDIEYFEFLVAKQANKLKDGEELDEEALADIAERVKAKSAGKSGNTTPKGDKPPKPGSAEAVSLEQFAAMNFTQKQDLAVKNPELYNSLFAEALKKKLL